ncbi:tRNA pseudouridine(38-40) synthase TruA [Clostridium sp. C105KSO13]|uniref:tRNA pseudouridine(38-40) synthase TruA n=1 Tax=Clostridium sp. C105KSO13 TaxID=1776045 RepID=UPI0007406CC7|nr:tRNA pseudouridine(38-40) synthase TruA [Clostridium sp. C105KSO13]CUX20385.1 tRNA pseudouridine synthase A [Clostridium sp. C105KSO13]
MRTYKLTVVYDGTRYQGWQRQKTTEMTIQEVLETAITQVAGRETKIDGSGRTDGGVHAKGQAASVTLPGKVAEDEFRLKLNAVLPEDVRVKDMMLIKNGFHARKNAKGKRYEYFVDIREKADVFTRKYCFHYPHELNILAMKEAAGYLTGTHDFAGFTDKKDEISTIRTIYDIIIEKQGDKLRMEYYGTGFMYHMIRILTGTLLEIGIGERAPKEAEKVLEAGQREYAGFLAPARGLFLKEVYYE